MLRCKHVPKPLNKPFQILEENFVSLSETIALVTPCNLETSFIYIYEILYALCVVFIRIKCVSLVNVSTMTMMKSCCFIILGNFVIKSIATTSHFHFLWEMVVANLLGVYALYSPFGIIDIWICNYPLHFSLSVESIGFLLFQLSSDISGVKHTTNYAFPSKLCFSYH
jgi:hypothetical protein